MLRYIWAASLVTMISASVSFADILVFKDGTRMEVQKYEVKGGLVLMTTLEGQLRSVPLSYVDMESTERVNRGAAKPARVEEPTEAPSQPPAPAETTPPVAKQPPVAMQPPPASPPPAPKEPPPSEPPQPQPTPPMEPPVAAATPVSPTPATPPPVWTDEELKVSLVIPSSAWRVETQTASFDVAVRLSNPETGARATLALVRKRMRDYGDFQEVVREIESSLASSPSFQSLGSGLLTVDPYTAHEFRYLKTSEGMSYYTRMVVYYSRDLAYVLSLTCLRDSLEQCASDFDALVSGLVIKKVRKDITPKGAPQG